MLSYQMHYFFFPQGFITAIKQQYARDNKVPIDQVNFDFELNNPDSIDGVCLEGLWMEGAEIDENGLKDQTT